MARRQIGVVGALWRYPVKSMRGEALSVAAVTQRGVAGDRAWALRECTYGGLVSARTWPAMLQLRAAWINDPVIATNADAQIVLPGGANAGSDDSANASDPITTNDGRVRIDRPDGASMRRGDRGAAADARVRIDLPNGASLHCDDPAAPRALSNFLHREVSFERVRTAPITPAEREAIMRGDALPPARDFFDEEVIHVIATGTLAHLRALSGGDHDFDARRFRANIVVDTGGAADRFIEDEWLDGRLEIGDAVRITGMRPALRCAITTHPQDELPHDPAILRTAWQFHQAYAGVFAAVEAEGTVRIGDPVFLCEMATGVE